MTNSEFSNEFDVLYNSITSNQAPGLDEYEKSVFLTNSQNDVLKSYFNPRQNKPQQGFDDSRKRQIDFSTLIKTKTLETSSTDNKFDTRSISYRMPNDLLVFINEACKDKNYRFVVIPITYGDYDKLMLKPYQYPIKRGVWRLIVDSTVPSIGVTGIRVGSIVKKMIIKNTSNKDVTLTFIKGSNITTSEDPYGDIASLTDIGKAPIIEEDQTTATITCVVSDTLDSLNTYTEKFLKVTDFSWSKKLQSYIGDLQSEDSQLYDLPISMIGEEGVTIEAVAATPYIELIGRTDKTTLTYTVRYLRQPRPIILTDLEEGLSIQGLSKESTCELPESLHQDILERAVELAKVAYSQDFQSQALLGTASKTDIGIISQSK